jgi:hypothetical protein
LSSRAADVACMTKKGNSTPDDVVKAFRKATSELGCINRSDGFRRRFLKSGDINPRNVLQTILPRPTPRLILEINLGKSLPAVVAHNKADV